ncbi:MAG: hypothetical protein NPIRA03_24380 [Nitrospirales bacterium]|nr:MAG: hypothetical protein NPIRA03_24380 [Nitrospirales bacterium]
MKKIKKKKSASQVVPAFLVGWTHGHPPPPGYIAAWFDEAYGGPLRIRFLASTGHHHFEAAHTNWIAEINIEPSPAIVEQWQSRLQWEQTQLALLFPPTTATDRRDVLLHVARMARGVTLLTEGTTYDVATGTYLNPSDWRDRNLEVFRITDHVQVEHHEDVHRARMWFHSRGLTKFGLDEIETFRSTGLSSREVKDTVLRVADHLIEQGKNPKVGERIVLDGSGLQVMVVRHRTDPLYGAPLAFREFILE